MKFRRPHKPTDLTERTRIVSMWMDGMTCRSIARATANMSTTVRMTTLIALLMVRKCVGRTMDSNAGLSHQTDVLMTAPMFHSGVVVDRWIDQVGEVVSQVVEQHLAGCHLVLVDTTTQSLMFSTMIRQLAADGDSVVVVDGWRLFSQSPLAKSNGAMDQLLQGVWGDATLTCRAVIILLDNSNDKKLTFRWVSVHIRDMKSLPHSIKDQFPRLQPKGKKIKELRDNVELFGHLYTSMQNRAGDLEEFFFHEVQANPPSLSDFSKLHLPVTNAQLLRFLGHSEQPEVPSSNDCKIMDGIVIVHSLPTAS
ncbi:uncharacterized protein LOC121857780, partial [Homarus americanus]|uniref:uncharacterized protein LOC121857780 n=1 Tax=Homarus americanus TaxID=6706 RepID=UPI001C45E445